MAKLKNNILFIVFIIVVASIGASVSGVKFNKEFFTQTRAGRISKVKSREGNCKFTLSAEWSPGVRDTEVAVMYNAGGEVGTPTVSRSPWSIVRVLPCNSRVVVQVKQVVYRQNEVACKILADSVIMDRELNSKARVTRCVA